MAETKLLERLGIAALLGVGTSAVLIALPSESLTTFIHQFGRLPFVFSLVALVTISTLLLASFESLKVDPKDKPVETFLLAMQGASDGLWVWDIIEDEVKITSRINEILGTDFPLEGITSQQLFSAFHYEDRDGLTNEIVRHMRGETDFFAFEYRVIQKDGSITWVEDRGIAERDETGKAIRIGGSVTEITYRKKAEQELAKHQHELEDIVEKRTQELEISQQRFKDFAEVGSDWFWETGPDHYYTHVSLVFQKITGIDQEQIRRINRKTLGALADLQNEPKKWDDHFADLEAHRPFSNFEYLHHVPNGKKLYFRVSGRPFFSGDGEFLGYRGVGSDITKEREAALTLERAKEAADQANRAKSEFLSRMSHELRTPLNGILGFAQLLELDDEHALSDQQVRFVGDIRKAGDHLLDLINEVLDLAKIESGGLMVSLESFDPVAVMNESIDMVVPLADKNGIRIVNLIVPEDLDLNVHADRTRFKQVAVNLLSNAIKYNRVHGSVILAVEKIGTTKYRFKVSDTGLGIPEESLSTVFDPFTRLEIQGGASEGTGIGLAITQKLVELMGGKIGVESTFGEGSTFWVDLPVSEENSDMFADFGQAPSLAPVDLVTHGKKLILYVEDNPANLRLMKTVLDRIPDVEMVTAETGEEGIKEAKIHHPDLILLDINLPGIDGIETLKILKATQGLKDTPVLALSAAAMQDDIDKGMDAGFDAYLTKPINIKTTLTAISEALGE